LQELFHPMAITVAWPKKAKKIPMETFQFFDLRE